MKKAIYDGTRDVRVEEVEEPNPGHKEAKIKVKYCGICGSDVHEYLHGLFRVSSFGHEVCGEIVEVGAEIQGFQVGDRVVTFYKDGYAEYQIARQDLMLRVPEGVSWERAAVLEPLAVAASAIERGRIGPTDTALIAGAGPVGLTSLLAVQAVGARTVYVSELSQNRRAKAEELGATAVLDPSEIKIPPRIRELTGGRGVDVAIEAVGIEATLKDCLASTRYRGKVLVQGIFTERAQLHMLGFVTKETTMIGGNSRNPALALEWVLTKGIEPERIVTRIIPLDQISTDGFEVLARDKERDIKILVEP